MVSMFDKRITRVFSTLETNASNRLLFALSTNIITDILKKSVQKECKEYLNNIFIIPDVVLEENGIVNTVATYDLGDNLWKKHEDFDTVYIPEAFSKNRSISLNKLYFIFYAPTWLSKDVSMKFNTIRNYLTVLFTNFLDNDISIHKFLTLDGLNIYTIRDIAAGYHLYKAEIADMDTIYTLISELSDIEIEKKDMEDIVIKLDELL